MVWLLEEVSPILQYAASPPSNASEDISIYSETSESTPYTILLDSWVTVEQRYGELIKAGHDVDSTSSSANVATSLEGINHFL